MFLKPRASARADSASPHALADFGSLNELASKESNACLALARIRYVPDGTCGWLVLVKPNLSARLAVDLINFAARNPSFPQQTTADQFFDEAQWESYYLLGSAQGRVLDEAFFTALQTRSDALFEEDAGTLSEANNRVTTGGAAAMEDAGKTAEPGNAEQIASRLPARIRAGAMTASIGLGAVATVLLSSWQTVDNVFAERAEERENERAAIKEISEQWAKLPSSDACDKSSPAIEPPALTALAGSFVRFADTLCTRDTAEWLQSSTLTRAIYREVVDRCQAIAEAAQTSACETLVLAERFASPLPGSGERPSICFAFRGESQAPMRPSYWGYSYAPDATLHVSAHPADPSAKNRAIADEEYRTDRMARVAAVCSDRQAAAALQPASAPTAVSARVPAPEPAPVSAPLSTVPPAGASAPKPDDGSICRGRTIYLQIYGPELHETVRAYRDKWRALAASVPPIEDVVASARAAGRPSPAAVSRTTVRYHDDSSKVCADALAKTAGQQGWTVEPLSPALRPTRGVIEVWVSSSTESNRQ